MLAGMNRKKKLCANPQLYMDLLKLTEESLKKTSELYF